MKVQHSTPSHNGRPWAIGHRGSGHEPENTLTSLKRGVQDGADRVEFDIRRLADGHYIAIHDGDLGRTTNGEGEVDQTSLPYILGLDAGDGSPPPTLTQVITWARNQNVRLAIEVKEARPEELAEILRDSGLDDPWVISFDHSFIEEFSRHAPDLTTGNLYSAKPARIKAGVGALTGALTGGLIGARLGLHPVAAAGISGVAGLVLGWMSGKREVLEAAGRQSAELVLPHHSLVDSNFCETVGKPVIPYTVNQVKRGKKLLKNGVSGLISDYPERFLS